MATLRDFSTLMHTSPEEAFLGFNNSFHDFHVLVTRKGKSVTLYDVESLNALRSWNCRPSETFTAAVCIDDSGRYVGVVNSKVLRLWTDEDTNLDSGQKIVVSTPIHAIAGERGKETIIIFKNGHVSTLSQVLHHPSEARGGSLASFEVLNQWNVMYTHNSIMVGLIVSNQQGSYEFIAITLDKSGVEQKRQRWTIEREELTIATVCIIKCERPTVVTISSDSSVHIFEPIGGKDPCSSWRQLKSMNTPSVSSCVDMVSLDGYHVAVVTSNNDGFSLTIWDLKYQVEKDTKAFSGFVFLKLFVCNKCLLLLCERTVLAVPIELESATLASVVGSLACATTTSCQHYELDSALNWVQIVDAEIAQRKLSTAAESTLNLEQELPIEVKDSVLGLLSEGKSTSVICRNVFKTLLESEKVDSLCAAIHVFEDIPEDILVRLLQFFLRLNINGVSSKKLSPAYRNSVKKDAISGVVDLKCSIINRLLCYPFNDVFLQDYVRSMPFQDVKMLLSHLCRCLDSPPDLVGDRCLGPAKVVDWICVIVDAHILNMTLTSDEELIVLLSQLNIAIRTQFSYLEELEKLESLLNQMKSKNITSAESSSPYCIEILRIT